MARAKSAGVEKIIVPGAKIGSSRGAVEIAKRYNFLLAAVGIHPHHAGVDFDPGELKRLAGEKETVAIGEIGLDRHHYRDYPELSRTQKMKQVQVFREQLKIAKDINLPVIIHCRDAYKEILEFLQDFINKEGELRGVFHCFEGEKEHLRQVLDLGFYVGFDGNITYPENKNKAELLKLVPADRLLLETDAPFLTPQKYRGERNEPAYILETALFISQVLGKSIKEIADNSRKNALSLFSSR